jgi:hypothetical protein
MLALDWHTARSWLAASSASPLAVGATAAPSTGSWGSTSSFCSRRSSSEKVASCMGQGQVGNGELWKEAVSSLCCEDDPTLW